MKKHLAGVLLACVGCAAALPVINGIIDVADAVCTQAEKQPEPQWVYFVCSVANAAPGVVQTFTMKVPADQAKEFATAHAPKAK